MYLATKALQDKNTTPEESIYTQRVKKALSSSSGAAEHLSSEDLAQLKSGMEVLNTFASNIKSLSKY